MRRWLINRAAHIIALYSNFKPSSMMSTLQATAFLLTVQALCGWSAPMDWTSVPMTRIVHSRLQHTSTLAYDISSVVPSSATEVLMLATVQVGYSYLRDRVHYNKMYTQRNHRHFEKYIVVKSYNQDAWSTNSDSLWFPVIPSWQVFVELFAAHTGNIEFTLHVIGYRWLETALNWTLNCKFLYAFCVYV